MQPQPGDLVTGSRIVVRLRALVDWHLHTFSKGRWRAVGLDNSVVVQLLREG